MLPELKRGTEDQALGRSRGDLSSKIHMAVRGPLRENNSNYLAVVALAAIALWLEIPTRLHWTGALVFAVRFSCGAVRDAKNA